MLQASLSLLLAAHLLAVNVAAGGPFVCIWLARRARRGDAAADRAGRLLARWTLDGLALGVILGLALAAMLWWLDQRAFFHALATIEPRRLAFGGLEMLFFYALMAWYLAAWGRWQRGWFHALIALAAGTNLVYHFPTLFTVLAVIGERQISEPRAFVSWLTDGEVLARVMHFCLASLAVTGGALLIAARRMSVAGEASADRAAQWGAHLIFWPTLLQLPLGLWVLLSLPAPSLEALMGGDLWGTAWFALALLATLALLHQLAVAILSGVQATQMLRSVALLFVVVTLMVIARDRARRPLVERREGSAIARPSVLASETRSDFP